VESPSPRIFKSHLEMVMGNWLYVALLELEPARPQRSLPTSTTL